MRLNLEVDGATDRRHTLSRNAPCFPVIDQLRRNANLSSKSNGSTSRLDSFIERLRVHKRTGY